MTDDSDCLYCLDASVLIDLPKFYPRRIFDLWSAVDDLAQAGRLVTFRGIADECHDEECVEWLRTHKNVVKPFSPEINEWIIRVLSELASAGKRMFNPAAEKDERDPFLVALALSEREAASRSLVRRGVCVLTQERRAGSNATTLKIPNVCDLYKLPCVDLFGLCDREGWHLRLERAP